ncbi:hypothetical protein Fmac_006034 [Flemingia macrophylla]|uniref:Leucine zipper homeobox-associated domain-containing protein n=1 Tax=Flemingia macrophylla TaxID=520843 RepID=A0ABD1N9H2_9FABA
MAFFPSSASSLELSISVPGVASSSALMPSSSVKELDINHVPLEEDCMAENVEEEDESSNGDPPRKKLRLTKEQSQAERVLGNATEAETKASGADELHEFAELETHLRGVRNPKPSAVDELHLCGVRNLCCEPPVSNDRRPPIHSRRDLPMLSEKSRRRPSAHEPLRRRRLTLLIATGLRDVIHRCLVAIARVNMRCRSKLKQTEMECEYLKRWFGTLTEQNRRLHKEVEELRAMKVGPPTVISPHSSHPLPASTLTMCPRCERVTTTTTTVVVTTNVLAESAQTLPSATS